MAFIYEVNGQKVEFTHEPTDADIDEAAASLGTTKAKPKSNMPKPVEGEGGAAFGVYRPQGRRPESQQDREASKEMPVQAARGVVTGALGGIPDILNLPGQIYGAATSQPAPYTVPLGSEEWNQILPGRSDTPHANLARLAGQTVAPVPIGPVVKAVTPAAKAIGSLAKDTAELAIHPIQTAKTGMEAFGRGYGAPAGTAENTALMPIRPTYYPHEQVAEFQAGTRPATQMTEQPTSNLIQTPTQKWAQNMAPVNEAGQPLVAPAGRGFEGYMENLGSTYKQNPYMAAIDAATGLGGMALTGLPTPVSAIGKAIPALAARTLQKATQFEPNFDAAKIAAAQARAGLESNMPPQTPALPAPGPVSPTLYANQQGVVTGQGGTSVPQQLPSSGMRAPTGTPAEISKQVAASKIQPIAPTPVPTQQADWAKRSGGGYTPPAAEAPAVTPATVKQAPAPQVPTNALEKNSNTFDEWASKPTKKAEEIQKGNVTFKGDPDLKITHYSADKNTLYGTQESTGKPIMIKMNTKADYPPNVKELQGEPGMRVYDVSKRSKPVEIANYDKNGNKMEALAPSSRELAEKQFPRLTPEEKTSMAGQAEALRTQIDDLMYKYQKIKNRYGEDSPRTQVVKDKIDPLRNELNTITNKSTLERWHEHNTRSDVSSKVMADVKKGGSLAKETAEQYFDGLFPSFKIKEDLGITDKVPMHKLEDSSVKLTHYSEDKGTLYGFKKDTPIKIEVGTTDNNNVSMLYDITTPSKPKLINKFDTKGKIIK